MDAAENGLTLRSLMAKQAKRVMELTRQQIERQDFVDNAVYELINELIPSENEMDWNIEVISEVRDTIQSLLVDRGFCTEQEFYPYIEE